MNDLFQNSTQITEAYRRLFQSWGLNVATGEEVFSEDYDEKRTVDLVVECTKADRLRLRDTVFAHFGDLNVLEFEGQKKPLTLANFCWTTSWAWGLGALMPSTTTGKIPRYQSYPYPRQRKITMVCANRSNEILAQFAANFNLSETSEPGIYRSKGGIEQWIICLEELELVPRNYPLLALARGEKLVEFIDICVREDLKQYIQLTIDTLTDAEKDEVLGRVL